MGELISAWLISLLFDLLLWLVEAATVMIYACHHKIKGWMTGFLPIGREYVLGALSDRGHNGKMKLFFPIVRAVSAVFSVYLLISRFSRILGFSDKLISGELSADPEKILTGLDIMSFLPFFIAMAISALCSILLYICAFRIFASKTARKKAWLWLVGFILCKPVVFSAFALIYLKKPFVQAEK